MIIKGQQPAKIQAQRLSQSKPIANPQVKSKPSTMSHQNSKFQTKSKQSNISTSNRDQQTSSSTSTKWTTMMPNYQSTNPNSTSNSFSSSAKSYGTIQTALRLSSGKAQSQPKRYSNNPTSPKV
jgi:hypothetical protein